MIDIGFKTYTDAGGGDPDAKSKTLKAYHQYLWSKELPSGKYFHLVDTVPNAYLYHESELGKYYLGSDAITHSYRNQKSKQWLLKSMNEEANSLFEMGSTIGAYLLFPNKQIEQRPTMNQARGVHSYIDDRFDLTLECIRRHYSGGVSPLSEVIKRYADFFALFQDFQGYVDFFLLHDLLDSRQHIKFYLAFDDFSSKPKFNSSKDYMLYKEGVTSFIESRNQRILSWCKQHV